MAVSAKAVGHVSGRQLTRYVETGAANTELVATISANTARRLVAVLVAYSNTPTQAGVTTVLDSGAGAGYDNTLDTGSANARYTVYVPTVPIYFGDDDALVVTAPAGGVGITASIAVYTAEAN